MSYNFQTAELKISLAVEHGGPDSVMKGLEDGLEKYVRKAHNRFVLDKWASWARTNSKAFARRNQALVIELEDCFVGVGLAIEDGSELDELIAECDPPMLSPNDAQALLQAVEQIDEHERAEKLQRECVGIAVIPQGHAGERLMFLMVGPPR